jgi:hypothetical protein
MSEERVDAGLRDLAAELKIVPSAAFTARVRATLAGTIAASKNGAPRLEFALAAAALALVAGSALWMAVRGREASRLSAVSIMPTPAFGHDVARAPTPTTAGIARPAPVRTLASRADSVGPPLAVSADTRLLVPSDQSIALRRLLRGLQQGWASVPAGLIDRLQQGDLMPDPTPIEIPLVTIELLPTTADTGKDRRSP